MKLVTGLPLQSTDSAAQSLGIRRMDSVSRDRIIEMLKCQLIEFVIANIGCPLEVIPAAKRLDFWKTELKPHLATSADRIFLEDYPGGYYYVASQWRNTAGVTVILLEKYH